MSKFIFIVFTTLTIGAMYMTTFDVGVMEPSIKKSSREGSAHAYGLRGVGRTHTGK